MEPKNNKGIMLVKMAPTEQMRANQQNNKNLSYGSSLKCGRQESSSLHLHFKEKNKQKITIKARVMIGPARAAVEVRA